MEAITMRPGRFIQLNEQERNTLQQLYRQTKDADMRSAARCCSCPPTVMASVRSPS